MFPMVQEFLYYTIAHGYLMQIMNKSATKWNGIDDANVADYIAEANDADGVARFLECRILKNWRM